jgi:hypothetical protein
MAKRVAKKAANDVPPLYMTVSKNGHLVPAAEYDFMRVQSYREGTRMVVNILPDGTRPGVRNWWRIIGAACKHDLLHGLTQSQADEAIRGALDMFNPVRMANGKWIEQRMSLNDLTDAELDEKIELLMGLIVAWSGVDLDSLQKAIPHDPNEFASDVNKEGFARSPAADTAKTVEGEGGADSSSPETESGTATSSPESNTSGEAPAAAPASTPNAGSGGTSEGVAQVVAEIAENTSEARFKAAVSVLPDDIQPNTKHTLICPSCGGVLRCDRASNGHVWIDCYGSNGKNGCFGPVHLNMAKNAVWPRPSGQKVESPADEGAGQHAPVEGSPAGDGGAPGSNGLAATDEPGLRPEDRAWLLTATRALLPVAKEGMSRGDINKVARDNINMMPKGIEKVAATAMDHIMQHVYRVAKGDEQLDWERVATLAHTTVKDLAELE